MNAASFLYAAGSLVVTIPLRPGTTADDPIFQAQAVGWSLLLIGLTQTLRRPVESEGEVGARRCSLLAQLGGILALLIGLGLALDFWGDLVADEQGRQRTEYAAEGNVSTGLELGRGAAG